MKGLFAVVCAALLQGSLGEDEMKEPQLLADRSGVRVYVINNFLSDDECETILRVSREKCRNNPEMLGPHVIATMTHDRSFLQLRKKALKAAKATPPLVCFQNEKTLDFLHPGGSGEDFTSGTTCVNSSFSEQLISSGASRCCWLLNFFLRLICDSVCDRQPELLCFAFSLPRRRTLCRRHSII